jgi:hypothetical protein
MTYELTTLLTTIAATSASFAAILGGLIASKLLSISGERDAVITRLQDINDEIEHRTKLMKEAQQENDEDDALDFISNHVESLVNNDNLDVIYENDEHSYISLEALRPLWERAQDTFEKYRGEWYNSEYSYDDHIPKNVALALKDDDFGYEVCKKAGAYLEKQMRKNMPGFLPMIEPIDVSSVTETLWYTKNKELIKEQENAIALLNLQRDQSMKTKERLRQPRGVAQGLVVFAIFSVLCIVLPLAFSPFVTESYTGYIVVKIVALFIFAGGLISIFGYLIWLLKWDDGTKPSSNGKMEIGDGGKNADN